MRLNLPLSTLALASLLAGCQNMSPDAMLSTGLQAMQAATLSDAEVNAMADEACLQMDAEAPIAPIFHGTRVFLKHPAVQNWEPTLLGLHRYQFIELATPATR